MWQKLCQNSCAAVLLSALLSITAQALKHPEGYMSICQQGDVCSISKPAMVAFGADEFYAFKVMQGTFICDIPAFNIDPLPNRYDKTCSIPATKKKLAAKSNNKTSKHSVVVDTSSSLKSGSYVIVSKFTGKVLEVQDYSSDDGARIIQADFSGSANQRWMINQLNNGYYSIRALHSRKSLDIEGWNRNDGADVQQLHWLNTHNQHWTIQTLPSNSFSIISRFSGLALDVYESNHSEGADLTMWTYWGGVNQQWMIIPSEEIDSGNMRPKNFKAKNFSF